MVDKCTFYCYNCPLKLSLLSTILAQQRDLLKKGAKMERVRLQRDEGGRFKKGWKGGPGVPKGSKGAEFRAMLNKAVTPDDFIRVTRTLVKKAKAGDMTAIKIFYDRTLGPPQPHDIMETLEQILAETNTSAQATS